MGHEVLYVATRHDTADSACPVPDQVLGLLYRTPQAIPEIAQTLPAAKRAELAMFCYQRAHLREIGVAVAAECDLRSLIEAGGYAGSSLYNQARCKPQEPSRLTNRRGITLAQSA